MTFIPDLSFQREYMLTNPINPASCDRQYGKSRTFPENIAGLMGEGISGLIIIDSISYS
jgi:hypothetical protein